MPKFHVSRSIDIAASPEQVFDVVADYGTWASWSPWLCCEPEAEVKVTDDPRSVGSMYSWTGDAVGAGELEHEFLERGRRIEDEIRFLKPFKSTSKVAFDFAPRGDGTRVTWHMNGSLPWFMFWMTSMMETFIGLDYERGLRMLKERIELGSVQGETKVHGVVTDGPYAIAGVRRKCSFDEIGTSMEAAFTVARRSLEEKNLPTNGEAISIYHNIDMKNRTFDYTSGFAVPESVSAPPAGLVFEKIPKTKAFHVEQLGSYNHIGNGWAAAHQVARYQKLKIAKTPGFEIYRNDPQETPVLDLKTDIYLPIR
ncbi:MAG: SRPBCC family protein [Planctomycetaceae bacterium]|nr:SRPBCC family protein [Planctomycetaceae bacterium]